MRRGFRLLKIKYKIQVMSKFQGFSDDTLKFFRRLDRNNNREWYAEHKDEYVKLAQEPMRQLVAELGPVLQEIDPQAIVDPKRVISRVYRDTRFSRNKAPYRPRIWCAFKRNVERWSETPVYFFEVEQTQYTFGMGMYCAPALMMRRFRDKIDKDPDEFLSIIESIRRSRSMGLQSEKYKRPLPHEHGPVVDPWYQSKNIAVMGFREPDKTLFSAKLADMLIERFITLKPLYDYLWKAAVV